ncbi:PREDICTED: LOW QUALITY PROTEIN, partial [Prunus dulcis]
LNSHAECVNHTLPTQNADTHGPLPFPQRSKQVQNDKYKGDIMEQFKKVQINIPLLEAIKQIPSYAKFLKDICTNKKRFEAHEKVMLSDNM